MITTNYNGQSRIIPQLCPGLQFANAAAEIAIFFAKIVRAEKKNTSPQL